jgi:hypothetical protein
MSSYIQSFTLIIACFHFHPSDTTGAMHEKNRQPDLSDNGGLRRTITFCILHRMTHLEEE